MRLNLTLPLLLAGPASAQTFTLLSPPPAQANAISDNGRVVAGSTDRPCLWNPALIPLPTHGEDIPFHQAWDVSNDGLTVAGESSGTAVLWSPAGDLLLGPGAARGLTPDGSACVGYLFTDDVNTLAFHHAAGVTTFLPPLPNHFASAAAAITPDGAFIAGTSINDVDFPPETTAVVWHDGVPTPLEPAFIYYLAAATGISADGSVVVGTAGSADGVSIACRWVHGVFDFVGDDFGSANACSADGSTVVGSMSGVAGRAYIWDTTRGLRSLTTILSTAGVDLAGTYLSSATGISADGNTIVGSGFDPAGNPVAWLATLSTPCPADFNGDSFLDFFDYDDYVTCFESGACPPGTSADFNHDNFTDFFDYDDFVTAFESGC